ncbi:MAG: response regulator transcription factor [Cyanobacteria bacterium P01_H01_bin.74]
MSTPNEKKTETILLVEDHALFSEGIKLVLSNTKPGATIYQAKNGKEALTIAKERLPSVVLMDIAMPEMNGLEASKLIKAQLPHCKIVMLTSFTDEQSLRFALAAGVEAYCSKDIEAKQLATIIDMVLAGGFYLDPVMAQYILKQSQGVKPGIANPAPSEINLSDSPKTTQHKTPIKNLDLSNTPSQIDTQKSDSQNKSDRDLALQRYESESDPKRPVIKTRIPEARPQSTDKLTAREVELLSLIADFRTNEEIAEIMGLTEEWLHGYIKDIIFKLAVDNEIEAVRRAVDEGVIQSAKVFEFNEI